MLGKSALETSRPAAAVSANPSAAARKASTAPSAASCRTSRPRELPRASRTATSRCRRSPRASSKLAAFAQAITSTSTDIAKSQAATRPLRTSSPRPCTLSRARAARIDPATARTVRSCDGSANARSSDATTRSYSVVSSALTCGLETSCFLRRIGTVSHKATPGCRQLSPTVSWPSRCGSEVSSGHRQDPGCVRHGCAVPSRPGKQTVLLC